MLYREMDEGHGLVTSYVMLVMQLGRSLCQYV